MTHSQKQKKTCLFWSGGKDSALAYDMLRKSAEYHPDAIITTINRENKRVSMHGVREAIIEAQAKAMDINLIKMYIPASPDNQVYEQQFKQAINKLVKQGFEAIAFGDIFLEDLKEYRENLLKEFDLEVVFPLWQMNTKELSDYFTQHHFKAKVICIDTGKLPAALAGSDLNQDFFQNLPPNVDVCGENGEYHSLVYDAPFFNQPLNLIAGETTEQVYENGKRFVFIFKDYSLVHP